MNVYRSALRRRILRLVALDALAIVFIILSGYYAPKLTFTHGFIRGTQIGIFTALQVFVLINILRFCQALKDDGKLRTLQIAEKDERAKFIRDKIGGGGFNFSIAAIALATVVAGCFEEKIYFTLLAVTAFMVLVKAALKVYYNTKF